MEKYSVPPIFSNTCNNSPDKPSNIVSDPYCVVSGLSYPDHIIEVPGSKSITNRALMIAALADGRSTLNGVLFSDDSRHFLQCLTDLGFDLEISEEEKTVSILGLGGKMPVCEAEINVGSAGTAARFLTAILGCSKGVWHLDSSDQMKRRPMKPLLDALKSLGCRVVCHEEEDHFPFTIYSDGITADEVTVDITGSSQFLSALLMSSVITGRDFKINITGSHGMAYIDMTIKLMQQFGVSPEMINNAGTIASVCGYTEHEKSVCIIPGDSHYNSRFFQIEPDVSAASYFYAMAAVSGRSFLVRHVHFDSLQGDIQFVRLLENMGCAACDTEEGLIIKGPKAGKIKGVSADLGSFSDQTLTLAAIAPFADGPVTIRNIGHIRLQECDRIEAACHNLKMMGIKTEVFTEKDNECIRIWPGEPKPAEIETYNDHRVAMAFTVTGLRAAGIRILDPMCCRKTFETFYSVLKERIIQ